MDIKKIKEGVSVKEIEGFAKKYRFSVFCGLAILLAYAFSWVFFVGWTSLFMAAGGIVGMLWSEQVEKFLVKAVAFFSKQEDTTQMILGAAGVVLSLFLPIVTFFVLGACGGKTLKQMAKEPAILLPPEEKKD